MSYLGKCTEGDRFVHDDGKCKGREVSKYNHYFKDVSNLSHIDVYRVIKLWAIEDPCQQHALKKVLCAGSRGSKNYEKDIREAIDSLNRLLEMIREDSHAGIDDESEIPYVIIELAPDWANWASRDEDGTSYLHQDKPFLGRDAWLGGEFISLMTYKIYGDISGEKFENSLRRVYRSQEEADKANGKSAG